jgi:ElaB/YqjD/DUF883 family membrane-anchored ribosome-binding protein
MADSTQVIQKQMEETRTRLADNLDKLTQQATETMGEVASSVTGTVDAVQETAEAVSETVQAVAETVQETVQDTVGGIKGMFDLPMHTRNHPWLVLGGSVALGFFVGRLLRPQGPAPSKSAPIHRKNGNGAHHAHEKPARRLHGHWEKEEEKAGWLSGLSETFEPALNQLKGLAIGATLGVARDAVVGSASGEFASQIRELFDDVTKRMGGQPMPETPRTGEPVPSGPAHFGPRYSGS